MNLLPFSLQILNCICPTTALGLAYPDVHEVRFGSSEAVYGAALWGSPINGGAGMEQAWSSHGASKQVRSRHGANWAETEPILL